MQLVLFINIILIISILILVIVHYVQVKGEKCILFHKVTFTQFSVGRERWRQEACLTKQMSRAGRLPGAAPWSWVSSGALTSTHLVNLWAHGVHSTFLLHQFNQEVKLEFCSPSAHWAFLWQACSRLVQGRCRDTHLSSRNFVCWERQTRRQEITCVA